MKRTGRLNTVGRVMSEKVQLRVINTGEGSGADDRQEGTEERGGNGKAKLTGN